MQNLSDVNKVKNANAVVTDDNILDTQSRTYTSTDPFGGEATLQTDDPIRDNKEPSVSVKDVSHLAYMLHASDISRPLRGSAADYLGELKTSLKNSDEKYELLDLGISGNYIATNGELAIHLCFPEYQRRSLPNENQHSVDGINVSPECGYIKLVHGSEVFHRFMREKRLKLLQSFIVPQSDYIDPFNLGNTNMAADLGAHVGSVIANDFKAFDYPYTLDDMYNFPMRINTDFEYVYDTIKKNHVHGVLPEFTAGYVVEICHNPEDIKTQYAEWSPLFAMGTRTLLCRQDNSRNSRLRPYYPLTLATAFVSNFRSELLQPWALTSLFAMTVQNNMWEHPFTAFGDREYAEYDRFRNIGSIVIDNKTNLPIMVNNLDEVHEIMRDNVEPDPVIGFDARFGEYLHPVMNMLLFDDPNRIAGMYKALKVPNYADISNLILEKLDYFTGIAVLNNKLVDSRSIDYFRVANQISNDPDLIDHFTAFYSNPEDHLRSIGAAGWGSTERNGLKPFTSLYTNTTHILNAGAICDLTAQCGQLMHIVNNVRIGNKLAFDNINIQEQGRIYRERGSSTSIFRQNNYRGRTIFHHDYNTSRDRRNYR